MLFEHFYKNKAPHRKQTAQLVFSVVILLLKFNFCLRINVFNRSIREVENEKLFISLLNCRNLAKLVILVQFSMSVVNNGLSAAIFTADR